MIDLIQIIYCSITKQKFTAQELAKILTIARERNANAGITGMLLYAQNSFFQVLEGESRQIDQLMQAIKQDRRHKSIAIIIREPIVERSFSDWTMGYATLEPFEADIIIGANDFFTSGQSFSSLSEGRAKKLLHAFKHGRWRQTLSNTSSPAKAVDINEFKPDFPRASAARPSPQGYSFAFQPIVNIKTGSLFSYEALLRGQKNEPAQAVLNAVNPTELQAFDTKSRLYALHLAAHLGLASRLNLNIIPSTIINSTTALHSVLSTAEKFEILPRQIVLEILESEIIKDLPGFTNALHEYRASGLLFAIDDFGAGYAGLTLLAEFQPHFIKLALQLVCGVESKGPRQAIIRGILRTCFELGIDVIAEGVETVDEYLWLKDEGVELFQGYLFAKPTFEELPSSISATLSKI
jgi:EAL domain-containing protein (putative c-di-GMP-specific phosphodiesterase class I)